MTLTILSNLDNCGSWASVIEVILLLYSFLGLAIICNDYMMPALETLIARSGCREDLAGATFMAFGNAAPEIIINVIQTIKDRVSSNFSGDKIVLGVGSVIGSGTIAFLIIPAACITFCDGTMEVEGGPMLRDIVFYLVSLFLTTTFMITGTKIVLWEAAVLLVIYVIYVATIVFSPFTILKYLTGVRGQVLLNANCSNEAREKVRRRSVYDMSALDKKTNSVVMDKEKADDKSKPRLEDPLIKDGIVVNEGETVKVTADWGELKPNDSVKDPTIDDIGESIIIGHCEIVFTILKVLKAPLNFVFWITCPQTEIGSQLEFLYPIAIFMSFSWVAFFSCIITETIEVWVMKTGISEAFFGLTLIAIGAQIPDAIESVIVAKRGYGLMALSNCIGSQTVNICVALGLPWFTGIASSRNFNPIVLTDSSVDFLFRATIIQGCAVTVTLFVFFWHIVWSRFKLKKIRLTNSNGRFLFFAYFVALNAYVVIEAKGG